MKRAFKIFAWLLAIVFLFLAGVVVTLFFAGGNLIKSGVNKFGPQLLGVPVTLQVAELHPIRGTAELKGLHVGNPEGFNAPSLFDVADISIALDTATLFSGTIHIRRIFIEKPRITYEKGNGKSNVGVVSDKLGGGKKERPPDDGTAAPPPPPEKPAAPKPPEPAKKPEQKVIIDELTINDPQLNATITALGGNYISVPLGQIEVKDVGKAQGGVTVSEAVKIIVKAVVGDIDHAIGGLRQTASELKKSAAPLLDAFKGLFGGGKKDRKKKGTESQPATNQAPPNAGQEQPANANP